jgi:hypothetical protein
MNGTAELNAALRPLVGSDLITAESRDEAPEIERVDGLSEGRANGATCNDVARTHARVQLVPWKQRFVDTLRDTPVVALACKAAGISRVTAYRHRDEDEIFRNEWDSALEDGWDGVEDVALRMARGGSERLVEFLLKGNKAKTYRETHKVEVEHGLSPAVLDILKDVRTKRNAPNVRNLPASEARTLEINDKAQD